MANLTKCSNGHFYDADKNRSCPYCTQTSDGGATAEWTPNTKDSIDKLDYRCKADDAGKTIEYYDQMETNPVVGWLVSIEGSTKGKDFRLCSGKNYIGRGNDMDIILDGDNMVSRSKHAIVLFDPMSQKTLCQSGESRELFYLNGKVITETVELKSGDVLTIGNTKLMYVPFCGTLYTWNVTE